MISITSQNRSPHFICPCDRHGAVIDDRNVALDGCQGPLQYFKEFEADYSLTDAIRWYTKYSVIFEDINAALRAGQIREILAMRLIIRHISHSLKQLYRLPEQDAIFYRGQCLCCSDIEQRRLRIGGVYPFNNFLSTSRSRDVANAFASKTWLARHKSIGTVLFQIHISRHTSKWTTFAPIDHESQFPDSEEEVLFSTNSIFRIGRINQLGDRQWEVNLFSTTDRDEELQQLTQFIRDAAEGSTEWERIGKILFNLGLIDTSKEVLDFMIADSQKDEASSSGRDEHLMGIREQICGNYRGALNLFYETLKYHPRDSRVINAATVNIHRDLASTYQQSADYQRAERFFSRAVELQEQIGPTNHIALLRLYQQLANVLEASKSYSRLLEIDKKNLDIRRKNVLLNELELAEMHRSIARGHYHLKRYRLCLEILETIRKLRQSCTEATDQRSCFLQTLIKDLELMGFSTDRKSIPQQLELRRTELERLEREKPVNFNALEKCYDALGQLHCQRSDYSAALKCFRMMRECIGKNSPVRYASLASTYDRIGQIYDKLGNHLDASTFYRKALSMKLQATILLHSNAIAHISNDSKSLLERLGSVIGVDAAPTKWSMIRVRERERLTAKFNATGDT